MATAKKNDDGTLSMIVVATIYNALIIRVRVRVSIAQEKITQWAKTRKTATMFPFRGVAMNFASVAPICAKSILPSSIAHLSIPI
jgi:hypothetical protein